MQRAREGVLCSRNGGILPKLYTIVQKGHKKAQRKSHKKAQKAQKKRGVVLCFLCFLWLISVTSYLLSRSQPPSAESCTMIVCMRSGPVDTRPISTPICSDRKST